MKIVHLIGFFQPEFGYKEFYLARNQVKLGHKVYMVTSDRIAPMENYLPIAHKLGLPETLKRLQGESVIDGINIIRLPTLFHWSVFIMMKNIKKTLKKIKPDLVYSYDPVELATVAPGWYKKELGYKWISDHQQFEIPRTILGKIYYFLISRHFQEYALLNSDFNIFSRKATKNFAIEQYNYKKNNYKLIQLGADSDFYFFDYESRNKIRKHYNLSNNDFFIIHAGKLDRIKKIEWVIETMRELDNCYKLLIIGNHESQYGEFLKQLTKELKIENRVFFESFQKKEKMHKFYSAADLGIWPKRPSICIVEAIACELPVVVPKDDVIGHYVRYKNGLTYEVGNIGELAKKISYLKNNPNILQEFRNKAKQYKNEVLDYKKIAGDIIEIYKKL